MLYAIPPTAVTVIGTTGITVSGADGITISGADSFVETGTNALTSALNARVGQTGIQSVDPELAVLLNRLTDDSNLDAVIIYHHAPTDADIAELKPQIPAWNLVEHHQIPCLERTFRLKNFVQALAFTNKVGALAEELLD